MTSDKDFIGQLEAYLDEYEGVTPLPGSVRDAVRAELPTTRQIGPVSGLMRDIYMNSSMDTPARWGLVAAVVIGAVIIGGALIFGGGGVNVGGSPSATPSPSIAATPAPPPAVVDFTAHAGGGAELEPGTYLIDYASPVEVTITVPAVPFGGQPTAWFKALYDWGPWHQTNLAQLGAVLIDNVYVDPCDPALGLHDPVVGPTVDDLVTALGSLPGLTVTASSAATLDGYNGQLMELTGGELPADCVEDQFMWETVGGQPALLLPTAGDRTRLWILDVGGTRLVVFANEDADFGDPEALQGLIDSIQIEAP